MKIILFVLFYFFSTNLFCQVPNSIDAGEVPQEGSQGIVIRSLDKRYTLNLQSDGNLVIYKRDKPVWSSKTNGKAVKSLVFQKDGNFVLYGYEGAIWSSNTANKNGTQLVLQNDGNLVIYDSFGNGIWSTNTQEKH